MSLLLETIKIENGRICNLEWHNARMNDSRQALLGITDGLDLADHINIPVELGIGIYRCRVLYGSKIDEIQFHPHHVQPFSSLKIIHCENLDYRYKYADRQKLQELFEMREDCDEILIIKDGLVTDTSISNIALLAGDGQWVTPDTPLLPGTMRQSLLDQGKLTERTIRHEDLSLYREARMINCMMDLATGLAIPIESIID
jgi:4-amino-4-deoxychorismate lyase